MNKDFDDKVGYHISVAAHLMRNRHNDYLSTYGLTVAQTKVLSLLARKGDLSQGNLQKKLLIKGSTMNGIIESMLKRELIVKKDNARDKRQKVISLTEKGEELQAILWDNLLAFEEQLMEGFSQEEKQLFLVWIKKVIANLEKGREADGTKATK
ncbi:MarR family transcriptional regulator [Halalkalibacterium halodurans]|uniref:BH2164 protein n=2 Tax=Halalkalibacterium halodurans TaxID=86665 RepID=Q9KAX2_HALH5|nr:MarR family transcriptional regulator [Halalkalibacterium halodurans]MDY7222720.1 MarR family transcriptional regulator [Halalkalibacterium halodurans]MDY7241941.1 MarR family transcriptional regulator [Halalkalibacterium halodurans]MED4082988.1 MarR family transcriptional regulator [Halalkalibacterium halodurans]MED4087149.1 MarR family transcriptional regulator [Halalkalibacterium halodurans]MED4107008.1 MarR family transcriptional regulator [Halalkalibacterium halodurans]